MWRQRKWNNNLVDYRKVKSHVYDNHSYHSKFEAAYAQELDLRKKAGDIKDWDSQFKVSIDINGHHICNYYVDFRVFHNDETVELVECKGFATDTWTLKRKLLEALYLPTHPLTRYTVVKP